MYRHETKDERAIAKIAEVKNIKVEDNLASCQTISSAENKVSFDSQVLWKKPLFQDQKIEDISVVGKYTWKIQWKIHLNTREIQSYNLHVLIFQNRFL